MGVAKAVVDAQLASVMGNVGIFVASAFAQQVQVQIAHLEASRAGLCVEVAMVASVWVVPLLVWDIAVVVDAAARIADSPLWPATEGRQLIVWHLVVQQLGPHLAYILWPSSLPLVLSALPIPLLLGGSVILAISCIQGARPLSPSPAVVQLWFAFPLRAAYHSLAAFQLFETQCPLA